MFKKPKAKPEVEAGSDAEDFERVLHAEEFSVVAPAR